MNKVWNGVAFIVILAGLFTYSFWPSQPQQQQTQSDTADYIARFKQPRTLAKVELVDQFNEPFTEAQLTGKWTLIFIGYTFCPDVCPTTLSELKRIYPQIKQIEQDVPIQVVFMSVDPNRDTPERMNEYVAFFNSEFIGVTGTHEVLFPLTRSMGLGYFLTDPTEDNEYFVNHSASIVLINPNAKAVGRFKPQKGDGQLPVSDGEQILHDLPALIKEL